MEMSQCKKTQRFFVKTEEDGSGIRKGRLKVVSVDDFNENISSLNYSTVGYKWHNDDNIDFI
jgi:putative salt-induced outer membrane protein YdiY